MLASTDRKIIKGSNSDLFKMSRHPVIFMTTSYAHLSLPEQKHSKAEFLGIFHLLVEGALIEARTPQIYFGICLQSTMPPGE
jgi:hypothetical protein